MRRTRRDSKILRPRTGPMRKLSLRLLLSVSIVCALLGGLEWYLNLTGFTYPPIEPIQIWNRLEDRAMRLGNSMHVESPRQLWAPDPGSVVPAEWADDERINDAGYRGPLRSREKKPGVLRIATLGDSSTFGHSVDYGATYSAQLEALLRKRGIEAEVINGGVVGFTIRQGLERYREVIRPYKPDVVIEAFGAVNDHLQALQSIPDEEKIRMHVQLGGTMTQLRIWMRKELRICHWLAKWGERERPEVLKQRNAAFLQERKEYEQSKDMGSADWEGVRRVPLEDFERCILELRREVEADGGALVLLSMPRQPIVEKESPVLIQYSTKIAEVAQREQLAWVDGRALYAEALQSGRTVEELFADNYHPKPPGHRLLAEALAQKIIELADRAKH